MFSPGDGRARARSEDARDAHARVRLFCDDWEQASHSGDLARVVESGQITREDVTPLGTVLAGNAPGRQSQDDVTLFDSTGNFTVMVCTCCAWPTAMELAITTILHGWTMH